MSEIDTLQVRLNYLGGNAEGRLQQDKLRSLKKSLLYSYQAATAILKDNREFRCLINKDKLSTDYDDKIISIPYKDICLNSERVGTTTQGEVEIGLQVGDTFTWKETDTNWIVYSQYLEEDAYFRADIRKCEQTIQIGENLYPVYIRGPVETKIVWNQKKGITWNDLNYTLALTIVSNEETRSYFRRFATVKIGDMTYEVQAANAYSVGRGILEVALKETFSDSIGEEIEKEKEENKVEETPSVIEGKTVVYPYDSVTYTVPEITRGSWKVDSKLVKVIEQSEHEITLDIITGRSGNFVLEYIKNNGTIISLPIVIDSL